MTDIKEKYPISEAEAKEVLEKGKLKKIQECRQEVETVLEKWGCTFDVSMIISVGKNTPIINIIEKV